MKELVPLAPGVPLSCAQARDVSRFGGKAARLAVLHDLGYAVPRSALYGVDAVRPLYLALKDRSGDVPEADGDLAVLWEGESVCSLRDSLVEVELGLDGSGAVRSSSVLEDGAGTARAGAYLTVLNVRNSTEVLKATAKVVASQWRDRGAFRDSGATNTMAILVQDLVVGEVSGVVFTRDPVGDPDDLLIEANLGLATTVVEGSALAVRARVERRTGRARELEFYQPRHFDTVEDGIAQRRTPVGEDFRSPLDRTQLAELTELALSIEADMGWPADIEWTRLGSQIVVLQCRPITTLEWR